MKLDDLHIIPGSDGGSVSECSRYVSCWTVDVSIEELVVLCTLITLVSGVNVKWGLHLGFPTLHRCVLCLQCSWLIVCFLTYKPCLCYMCNDMLTLCPRTWLWHWMFLWVLSAGWRRWAGRQAEEKTPTVWISRARSVWECCSCSVHPAALCWSHITHDCSASGAPNSHSDILHCNLMEHVYCPYFTYILLH